MFCNCNQKNAHGSLALILKALGHIVAIIGLWQHSWPMIVLAAILFVLSYMDWSPKVKDETKPEVTEKKEEVIEEKPQATEWEAPVETKTEPSSTETEEKTSETM